MPSRPKRPCNQPGCPNLTSGRYCEQHAKQTTQQYDKQRGTAAQRGYNYKWRRYSEAFLKLHPWCECDICAVSIDPLPSEAVDHIIPHKGDLVLFWDKNNHKAMAKRCHDRKTVKQDGGFGKDRITNKG